MQPEKPGRKNKIKQSHHIVWLAAFLLTVLVAATISVVGTCMYAYAHRSDCQISLYDGQVKENTTSVKNAASVRASRKTDPVIRSQAVQYSGEQAKQQSEKSAFEVKDTDRIWKTETAIDLFDAEYKNADGVVTVKSADGSEVIAPGTEGSYTFSLKNTSNLPADYKIWVEAKLSSNITGVPIQTRMSGSNGWLLGEKNTWEQADSLNGVATAATIDAGKSAEYTIYWQWPFEQGADNVDTSLSNASVSQEMSYTVTIYTMTATATGSENNDSRNHLLSGVKTGDTTKIFVWVIVLVVSVGAIGCLIIWKKRKNDEKNEQNNAG